MAISLTMPAVGFNVSVRRRTTPTNRALSKFPRGFVFSSHRTAVMPLVAFFAD
jgi:hypothetical protein